MHIILDPQAKAILDLIEGQVPMHLQTPVENRVFLQGIRVIEQVANRLRSDFK